ncbi:MAG: hypothetical protein AAF384_13145 [Pseudomonadota bacterium]
MCHQTGSLIARYLEASGIPTLCIGSALDILQAGNPPRAVFIDYPLGHTMGRPFDRHNQRAIVNDALSAFESISEPGTILSLDYQWPDSPAWKSEAGSTSGDDTRAPRDTEPVYQMESDRIAAEAAGA